MGEEDQIFIDFVMKRLRKKDSPTKLMKKIAEILEEDAEDFIYKLWRMIIF